MRNLQTLTVTAIFPLLYIAPFYIFSGPRSDPSIIRRRVASTVIFAVSLSWLPTYLSTQGTGISMPILLGLRMQGLLAAFVFPLFLTSSLYIGHLYVITKEWLSSGLIPPQLNHSQLILFRNIIASPFTEELVFRSGLISYYIARRISPWMAGILSPLVFGACHFHHIFDMVTYHQHTWKSSIPILLVQFTYSSIFGIFSSFLFLRTEHVIAPIVAHAFCNAMGLPTKLREYTLLHSVGVAAFCLLLFPLTHPALYKNY